MGFDMEDEYYDMLYTEILGESKNPYNWHQSYEDYLQWECDRSAEPMSAKTLYYLMTSISEKLHCAGWITGNEFSLWNNLHSSNSTSILSFDEQTVLQRLSGRCNGWWVWHNGERFCSLNQWNKIIELDKVALQ